MKTFLNICEIFILILLAFGLIKLFKNTLCSIRKKEKLNIAINSLIFIICTSFYFVILSPVERVCLSYQEIIKALTHHF